MDEYKGTVSLDASLMAAGQAVEHYEMARHGTLPTWAARLSYADAAKILETTLLEERAAEVLRLAAFALPNLRDLRGPIATTSEIAPKLITPIRIICMPWLLTLLRLFGPDLYPEVGAFFQINEIGEEPQMDRRLLLSGAALGTAGLFAARAFAQDASGEAETKHAADTGMVGSLSLLQSRLAATKATDTKVKQFAGWEVAEQETVGDILKSMKAAPDGAQGALVPPTDEEAMAMIDEAGKAKLVELETLAGAEFDKAYVAANLGGHQKLLTIQEDYLKVGANREHLDVAKLARGIIKEHIAHLEELSSKLS